MNQKQFPPDCVYIYALVPIYCKQHHFWTKSISDTSISFEFILPIKRCEIWGLATFSGAVHMPSHLIPSLTRMPREGRRPWLEPKNVRVPRVRCKFRHPDQQIYELQRSTTTTCDSGPWRDSEIQGNSHGRLVQIYWTCKTPSVLPKKRQFSKLKYGEYWLTNT